ncbi:MAG: hypothetical protein JWO80_3726, partial [Bryobacterales bacterium]|nr:hypothetical protein [Bryobacterales bacterium]
MKVFPIASAVSTVVLLTSSLSASDSLDRAFQYEKQGNPAAARSILAKAAQASPHDARALMEYAEFLDRYGDPEARAVYRQAAAQSKSVPVLRRLVLLDLIAGDRAAGSEDLATYHAAGGTEWKTAGFSAAATVPETKQYIKIPGPLHSFGRMAAISPDSNPDEVLISLARNVVTNGYQASHSNDALEQTEYLKLVNRYLSQARELEKLAGPDHVLKIATCDATETGDLLRVLGFRMRGACGSDVVLETVNATRAFLSTDSGFPMAQLEQALRTSKPFTYDFSPTKIAVLYGPGYWITQKEKSEAEFIDTFLGDPSLCRFYLGMAKLDRQTADELKKAVPAPRLRAYAHVLDFFGGMFEIRDGKAVVPGGRRAVASWGELVGVSPDQGAAFFEKLLAKDDGWMASQFDALSRIHGPVQDYLTDSARMKRFYSALRGKVTSPGPARPVFRANADMMLLTTRLRLDANGQPHIPGSIETWKNLFINHPHGKYDARLTKAAPGWKDPDDVLEALFGLSRKSVENEPLKIFMALSDLDRNRTRPLQPATVDRLARSWKDYGSQYAIFNDAPALKDSTILAFLDTAASVEKVKDTALRQNMAGTMQSLTGLWQIFCRQGLIAQGQEDQTMAGLLQPFSEITSEKELFDGGRAGVKLLLTATGSTPAAGEMQERLLGLLAGVNNPADTDARDQMVTEMVRVLEAQRILPLDTILQLADNLDSVSRGQKLDPALAAKLASRVAEIQQPRSALSGAEKNALAFGYWTERHIETERKTNIRALIDKAQG